MGGYLNNANVHSTVRMLDEEGCTIQLRDDQNFLNSDTRSVTKMHVEFDNLSYCVYFSKGNSKTILENVTGCFRSERLTAIVGPSGAGKTTLLRIICAMKMTNVNGSITVNGKEWNGSDFRKETCFLPQEFALLPLLTIRETLYIAARLKVHGIHESRAYYLIVTEIAESLNLTNCLDTLVENLSGGERKRLSIGIEIITKPSVLLFDEPTSGLDSTSSNQVIGLLHKIAKGGCTVACAIHQPSSRMISQFDDLLVLHNGTSFYYGPWDDVFCTFSDAGYTCPQFYNISEFVLEVITGERSGDLNNLYKISRDKYSKSKKHLQYSIMEDTVAPKLNNITSKSGQTVWQEQKILFLKAIICIKRDNTLTKLRFAAHVIVAFLLGIVFYDSGNNASRINSNIACIFFVLLFLYFANSMPAVQMFPVEAAVFLREYLSNWYRLRSYFSVKVFSDLPLQILAPTVFITITYYMTGQPMEHNRFFRTWLICILTTILGQSSGMLIGVAFNTHLGTFLIPAINMPMILFAGFFLKFSEVTPYLQPLCAVSFFRYAFEGILQAIYDGNRERLQCYEIYCHVRLPKKILEGMDMPAVSFCTTVISLCIWILCLQLLTYLILKWKARNTKR
ncbi:PREDICTED: ATP-binding cassette sub-family G member 4-like isoform X2 [Eufriesea mexicana]|uniref:ATP-binding cassette sub-family G member 4-like isoform X2 n=1 Tax=Eufriesea mexicana TaxID=516756 RepID=UPI00083BF0EF|nr:PREDICTED: ATP-binding cassette sub-family G member 4-like isoform X2 [Eufriesea mexicana]